MNNCFVGFKMRHFNNMEYFILIPMTVLGLSVLGLSASQFSRVCRGVLK